MAETTESKVEAKQEPLGSKSIKIPGRDTNSNDAKALRCRVFVGNLSSHQTNKLEIKTIFEKYGEIESISLHHNFGFIQFVDEKGADAAVDAMHGKTIFGKRVDVNLAGLRRRPQDKDRVEGAPSKEEVVPPEMLKKFKPPPQRGRDRSPIGRDRELPYGSTSTQLQRPPNGPFNPYFSNQNWQRRPPFEERKPPLGPIRPSVDCEIVAMSKELSRYAEDIESRLRGIGLVCNIGYPPSELPITELMERIARTGTLYAVVVTDQNAQHHSCTLNLLQGTRQEHRNMPLKAALSFIARNFDSFLRGPSRESPCVAPVNHAGYTAPQQAPLPSATRQQLAPPSHIAPPNNLNPTATKEMSTTEIDAMIQKLQREKEEREALSNPSADYERRAELSNQIRSSTDMAANTYLYPTSTQQSVNNGASFTPISMQQQARQQNYQ